MTNRERFNYLNDKFIKNFGISDDRLRCFFAPGRVNLIGEHTDYNHGLVMPFAINLGTWLAIRPNRLSKHRFVSTGFDESTDIQIDKPFHPQAMHWWKYPLGILQVFREEGFELAGHDFLFNGNLPRSSGLSSSASIEMVTAKAINTLIECPFDNRKLVDMARKAENEFIGLNCGIMDMFAIGMGHANMTILLDCHTNRETMLPLHLTDTVFVVGNTNVSRGLADSKYNERVAECESGLSILKQFFEIEHLGQLLPQQLAGIEHLFQNRAVFKRLHHVASENMRVRASAQALTEGCLEKLGELLNESHFSLRDYYEVSCKELDVMTHAARSFNGTLGSRMTGAGFGGCTLSLVKADKVQDFVQTVGSAYLQQTGRQADFYVVKPSDGIQEIIA